MKQMRESTQDVLNKSRGKINTQPFNVSLIGINAELINVSNTTRKPGLDNESSYVIKTNFRSGTNENQH